MIQVPQHSRRTGWRSTPRRDPGAAGSGRWLALAAIALIAIAVAGGCALSGAPPFDPARAPPAPQYELAQSWLALSGRPGLEQSAPRGIAPVDREEAGADVFFIHPTTFKGNSLANAPYDASDAAAPLTAPVLIGQASVFNGCCRIYAPRYRQASVGALGNTQAMALAYSDVARAFRYFIAFENQGRPFIIASHSQGTMHAVRLLQDEILQTPLKQRMVAAYLIGGYVPANFSELGLPTCDSARQTGCVLSYNTSQQGRSGARLLIERKTYWWRGALKTRDPAPAICVNPLTWRREGAAAAQANPGSLPFPEPPFGQVPKTFDSLLPGLTGAQCQRGLLEVDIDGSAPEGFRDKLSFFTGSYHLGDYGVFYSSLRGNALDRVNAWLDVQEAQAAAARRLAVAAVAPHSAAK